MKHNKDFTVLNGLFRLLVLCDSLEIDDKDKEYLNNTKEYIKEILRRITDEELDGKQ